MIVLHTILFQKGVGHLNEMAYLYMTRFQSCMSRIVLECQCVKVRLLYITIINFKHFCNVKVFRCGENNQRPEFLILFRYVVSKVWSDFSYILSPQKCLILLIQYSETSQVSVPKIWKSSWKVQKTYTNLGTAAFICTWILLIADDPLLSQTFAVFSSTLSKFCSKHLLCCIVLDAA